MIRQHELIAQVLGCVLHINTRPGHTATASVGGQYNEVSVLVLDERLLEPLLSRTAELATPADSELTLRRVHRTLQELVQNLQRLAEPEPRGAA